jgi:hypothetical protein
MYADRVGENIGRLLSEIIVDSLTLLWVEKPTSQQHVVKEQPVFPEQPAVRETGFSTPPSGGLCSWASTFRGAYRNAASSPASLPSTVELLSVGAGVGQSLLFLAISDLHPKIEESRPNTVPSQ